jgi:flagellar P-ring protein FlgI
MNTRHLIAILCALAAFGVAPSTHAEHLRDIADIRGARENQVVGYGIVTGLSGTGDDVSAPFAAQSVMALLRRLGVQIDPGQLRLRNVAAVIVVAQLPAFAKQGTKLDVTIGSIGNARSLVGGVLVQTLLKGADQSTYAVAQGPVLVGGFSASGASGSSVKQSSLLSGRIPEGALIEREVAATLVRNGAIDLSLRTPGFGTAANVTAAVNAKFPGAASALDGGAIRVKIPKEYEPRLVELVAALEEIEVSPVRRARVVVNERTGTVVAGGDVRLAPAAVVHGGLTIVVRETPEVSQPNGGLVGQGTTAVVPRSDIAVHDGNGSVAYVKAAPSLADVATTLGKLGLSPRELVSVLQALRTAGALEAEVVVQ